MKKSYNDIMQQAERLIEWNKSRKLFTDCHGRASSQEIWQLAAVTRSQHGISLFCRDRDEQHECARPYTLKISNYIPWWQTDEWKKRFEKCHQETLQRKAEYAARKIQKDPCEGMNTAERITWCVQSMHNSTIEEMRFRILDMLKRSLSFGVLSQEYGCNPLQLTQAVYADTRHILERYNQTHKKQNGYQMSLEL